MHVQGRHLLPNVLHHTSLPGPGPGRYLDNVRICLLVPAAVLLVQYALLSQSSWRGALCYCKAVKPSPCTAPMVIVLVTLPPTPYRTHAKHNI